MSPAVERTTVSVACEEADVTSRTVRSTVAAVVPAEAVVLLTVSFAAWRTVVAAPAADCVTVEVVRRSVDDRRD